MAAARKDKKKKKTKKTKGKDKDKEGAGASSSSSSSSGSDASDNEAGGKKSKKAKKQHKLKKVAAPVVTNGDHPKTSPEHAAELTEGSGPHTTIRSWQETAEGPETVTTETDEHGNIITRTVKSHQVKQTIQRQTYQTYQVPLEEGADGQTTTVTRQLYSPAHGQPVSMPVGEDGVPLVESHSRTIAYEAAGAADPSRIPENVPGEFVSSRTVTSGNRTVETITYKTEKDGVTETHVEHRVTIHSGGEIDHDAELSAAIMEATNMNPDMTVEKIEVKQESQC